LDEGDDEGVRVASSAARKNTTSVMVPVVKIIIFGIHLVTRMYTGGPRPVGRGLGVTTSSGGGRIEDKGG
jgi:hypothetical protein